MKRYGMKVSIIIPVYNAAKSLRECLDSVCVAAEKVEAEIICVDDGSTDESGAILDEYARRQSNNQIISNQTIFKVVHQQNTGAWAARNAALEIVQGEYITFADADDCVRPGWLEKAMTLADESRSDLVRLRPTCEGFGGEDVGIYEGNAAAEWAWETLSEYGYLWLCFIRKDAIGTLRFRPVINCKEDGIFLMELIPWLRKVHQGSFAGYEYRTFAGSLTKKNRRVDQCVAYLNAYREIWLSQREWAKTMGVSDLVRRRLRQGADHDVWEWNHQRKLDDKDDPKRIRAAYLRLEASGALWSEWCHQKWRLHLPFLIWKMTGSWTGFKVLEWVENVVRKIRRI